MNDFICSCLFIDGAVIDRITDDFDIDFDEDEVLGVLRNRSEEELKGVGRELLCQVLEKIIALYPELDGDKFDYDFSSPSYPDFYYGGLRFETKDELDAIAEEVNEEAYA